VEDRFDALRRATVAAVLTGPGTAPAELRDGVFRAASPPELAPLVELIRQEPWTVTDEDWAPLRAKFPDEDHQFELVVAAVLGAAGERLDAALRAIEEA
jgi:hypothetical protein